MASVAGDTSANMTSGLSSIKDSEQAVSFIRDSGFSPVIALLTSYDVEVLCEKNNLSFCELLLPFTQLAGESVIRDPNNQNLLIRNLRLDFRDLRRDGFLSNAALSLAVGELLRQHPSSAADGAVDRVSSSSESNYAGDINTPWYDSYRRQFLRLLDPPDHEFNRHYLACILVVSTMHDDPLDQLNRLSQAQHALQHQQQGATSIVNLPKHAASPKWFSPNTFKYHLVVHDVAAGDDKKAESIYQGMKMTYGANACHLLRINSAPATNASTTTPDPWARYLRYRLRQFNSLRILEDEDVLLNEHNDTSGAGDAKPPTAVANGQPVFVAGDQTETSNKATASDGTTIPHPLSCNDLPGLETQQSPAFSEKEERAQTVHHGQCLTPSDIDRIKIFVQEFSVRGLVPYVERQLRLLNEQVNARRGFQKTVKDIFTTKLWGKTGGVSGGSTPNLQSMAGGMSNSSTFGYMTSSPSTLPSPDKGSATGPSSVVPSATYAYESAEMQTRRLADLAGLFQNYELAFSLYNSLKKEFHSAQAWLHSASAAEFATLCIFLAGPTQSRPYRAHYMDEAINTYLASGAQLLASRATIYSTAVLCASFDHGQAAAQYIRLSSGDDLRSALFLEQAACCFVRAGLKRKAALHLILAGHRYGKAAKRQHTIRCYQTALKSYQGKGWRHASEHIYFTLDQEMPSFEAQNVVPPSRSQMSESRSASSFEPFIPKAVKSLYDVTNTVQSETFAESIHDQRGSTFDSIRFGLSCQPLVEHDFNAHGLCRITVVLDIQYSEEVEELSLKAYAGGMSAPSDFQQFYRGYPLLLWSASCRRVRLLAGQSLLENGFYRRRVELTALVTIPGIYDISSLRLSCRRRDAQWEDLPLLQSQFLTVIQSSSTDYSQLRSSPDRSLYYSMS